MQLLHRFFYTSLCSSILSRFLCLSLLTYHYNVDDRDRFCSSSSLKKDQKTNKQTKTKKKTKKNRKQEKDKKGKKKMKWKERKNTEEEEEEEECCGQYSIHLYCPPLFSFVCRHCVCFFVSFFSSSHFPNPQRTPACSHLRLV